jgi:site-specific DNA-methyltransferase (adenine-specific)
MAPYYSQDGITIFHGDCLEVLAGLKPASADILLTDPPYFLPAAHYSTRSRTFRSLSDLSILEHFFRSVFAESRRVLTPQAFAYVFCDGQSYPVMYATAYAHFRAVRPLIWNKVVSINGYGWRHQHELILYAESEESPSIPTGDGDVLECRAVKIDERKHLAEKPVSLLERLVRKSAYRRFPDDPAGVVLDPFGGSFSVAEACVRAGRGFVGIEREERYCDEAARRLAGGDWRHDAEDHGNLFGVGSAKSA